jgi:hypothetical protein
MVDDRRLFDFVAAEGSKRQLDQKMSRFWDRRIVSDQGSRSECCPEHLRRPIRGWRVSGRVGNPSETGCRHGRQDDRAREI